MRAIERKRPPFMTPQRWIFLAVAFVLLLVTLLFIFYRNVQSPIWSEERAARQDAIEIGQLQEVQEMYKHVWDTVSWIVRGVDENGTDLFVWMPEDSEPFVSLASEAFGMDSLRSQLLASKPGAEIKHIRPALFDGSQSWEIFYTYNDGSLHYYYDFYDFISGKLITTYKLPAKTEP